MQEMITGQAPGTNLLYSTKLPRISYTDCSLCIENSKAQMHASMKAYFGTERVRISFYLQKMDGISWMMVKHWTQDFIGTYGTADVETEIDENCKYRLFTYYYAYKEDKSSNLSMIVYDDCISYN